MGPWYHPSAQELQPLFGEHRLEGDGRGWVRTHSCLADAWNGGGSLLIQGLIPPEVGHVAVRWVREQGGDARGLQPLPSSMATCSPGQMGVGGQDRGLTPDLFYLRGEKHVTRLTL